MYNTIPKTAKIICTTLAVTVASVAIGRMRMSKTEVASRGADNVVRGRKAGFRQQDTVYNQHRKVDREKDEKNLCSQQFFHS